MTLLPESVERVARDVREDILCARYRPGNPLAEAGVDLELQRDLFAPIAAGMAAVLDHFMTRDSSTGSIDETR